MERIEIHDVEEILSHFQFDESEETVEEMPQMIKQNLAAPKIDVETFLSFLQKLHDSACRVSFL